MIARVEKVYFLLKDWCALINVAEEVLLIDIAQSFARALLSDVLHCQSISTSMNSSKHC